MSNKKTNYAFSLTDTRNDVKYNVVWSTLWKLDGDQIILPKSAPKPYAYAYNVFRENEGWIGGGSFIVLDHRPNENDAMQALGIVLQHEVNQKAEDASAAVADATAEGEVVKADASGDSEETEAPETEEVTVPAAEVEVEEPATA